MEPLPMSGNTAVASPDRRYMGDTLNAHGQDSYPASRGRQKQRTPHAGHRHVTPLPNNEGNIVFIYF